MFADQSDYVARALRGGYPEAVRRDPGRRRARFFDSYVTDLVSRDVQQISDIERPAEMRRLLSVVAARMGTLAVIQSIANDVALPRQTLSRYLDLLELVFVIKRVPAWSSNLTTRAISTPKLIVTDSGLGSRLIGMSEERAKDPVAPVGPLLENFAIGEVARQLTWTEEPVQLFHYRDRDQVEVDMVLEHAAGTVIGIEVKAAESVRSEDFRGLRHLANRLGDRFRAGIVLYAGEQQLSFGDRLAVAGADRRAHRDRALAGRPAAASGAPGRCRSRPGWRHGRPRLSGTSAGWPGRGWRPTRNTHPVRHPDSGRRTVRPAGTVRSGRSPRQHRA